MWFSTERGPLRQFRDTQSGMTGQQSWRKPSADTCQVSSSTLESRAKDLWGSSRSTVSNRRILGIMLQILISVNTLFNWSLAAPYLLFYSNKRVPFLASCVNIVNPDRYGRTTLKHHAAAGSGQLPAADKAITQHKGRNEGWQRWTDCCGVYEHGRPWKPRRNSRFSA